MSNIVAYQETDEIALSVREAVDAGRWKLEELSLELSNRCLLRCRHCSSGSKLAPMENELEFEDHIRLMREAVDLGATVLSLSGGDPILSPRIVDYVDYGTELGFETILLYTTGIWKVDLSFVDGGIDSRVGKYGVASLKDCATKLPYLVPYKDKNLIFVFSLHSHDASTNDYIMKMPGAFRAIIEAIKFLVAVGVEVWVHFVPMQLNLEHISDMRDLCVELGVKKLSLLRFVPQTRGELNQTKLLPSVELFNRMQELIDYEMTDEKRKDLPCAIRAGCPADFRHSSVDTSIFKAGTGKPKLCHAGLDLILVRPDGAVHPCAAWKSLPTDSNVRNKSLTEIWEGDDTYSAIRRYLQEGYAELKGGCASCKDLETCRGGCPAQRLHAFGRSLDDLYYPEPDPLCPTRLYR